jgi:hypothetical protein
MTAVTLDVAVPAMVAVMRGRWIGRLCLGRRRTLWLSRLRGECWNYGYKKRRRRGQQEESKTTFHWQFSQEESPVRILNHR